MEAPWNKDNLSMANLLITSLSTDYVFSLKASLQRDCVSTLRVSSDDRKHLRSDRLQGTYSTILDDSVNCFSNLDRFDIVGDEELQHRKIQYDVR